MADDKTGDTKSPEEKAAGAKKRELRRLKVDMKVIREKTKDLTAERKKLEERHNALAAELGLPLLGNRGKKDA